MIEEESYSALYLYNALIEYIYFLIILIQDKGPNDLENIAKYVRFYKKDVYTFIQIFNGKGLTEKVNQMLCSATSVFEVKDNVLHLTNNYSNFKQIIYEDLLVSKVVDLLLRGICRIKDICQNLNFNSIISIEEDILITVLKYYPYFHFDSTSSVILIQFHGLVGFEKHTYHATVKYFQSYLQNINELTCNDIKLHSSCIPSCAARNSLVIFCILHVSPFFKCKKGKISLRKTLKRKRHHEQVIDIEKIKLKISSESLDIGLLVYKAHGPLILSWTGEINSLSSCAGLIQSVVSFTNGNHGIFLVYFYKTALKYACEVGDLKQFLNVCDVIEFDAEFCGAAMRNEVFWQATCIKVTKRGLKGNKYELNLDIEQYMENVNLNNHKLKPLSKVCTGRNCLVEYTVLEKENTSNHRLQLNSSRFTSENVSKNRERNAKGFDKIEPVCNGLEILNCDHNTSTEIKSPSLQNIFNNSLDDTFEVDFQKLPQKCAEENDLHAVVAVSHTITMSNEDEFSINHSNESSEESYSSVHDVVTDGLKDLISVPHKIAMSHAAKNELPNEVAVQNVNKNSIKQNVKFQKEILEENELVNSLAQNGVKYENEKSITCPKNFLLENKLFNEVSASKEKSIPHESKNEADWSIIHPKLPKNYSEEELVAPYETSIQYKVKNKENSAIHSNLIASINSTSSFLLGEVAFISSNDGVAYSLKNEPCEIFFKKDDVCFPNAFENVLEKGNTVLLFIPFFELGESVLIATLVYPLTSEESIEAQKNCFSVQDFVVNHFSQRVKKNLCDTWVCNCDISNSLLVGTRLGPNFTNFAKTPLKYLKIIKMLHEICNMSDKTYKSLCSLVNQVCAQNIGETCRKLLMCSPFSLAKSLSRIRHSKDCKKTFVNRCKFIARKQRRLSFVDTYKENCDHISSIFCKTNNIPTIILKPSSCEEQCIVDDNCNIVDSKTPNNKLFANNSALKQCFDVSHESSSSVGSFSSCVDDSKDLSDDVFYSCESDIDSSPAAPEQCHPTNKPSCETNGNSFTAINDKTSLSTFTDERNGLLNKRCLGDGDASSYLRLRHSSLFKPRRKKSKVILPSKNNFCKTCYKPSIEIMAEITIIKKSHLYFKIENEQQIVTLAFPKCLIPVEMQDKIRLNSIINITVALHPLINLSRVLHVDFQ